MNKWIHFSNWTRRQGVHTQNCSIVLVFEYLLSLKESGVAVSSLEVHLTAVSAHHAKI